MADTAPQVIPLMGSAFMEGGIYEDLRTLHHMATAGLQFLREETIGCGIADGRI